MKSLKVAGFLAFTAIKKGNFGVVLFTIVILVLVALNLIFVPSLLRGLVASANDKLINTYAGDIIIESTTDDRLIHDVDNLINSIETIDGVLVATPRNSLGAQITFADEYTNCTVYGIRPEKELVEFRISESLIEGTYLDSRDRDQILLGIQLAGADRPDIELFSRSLKKVHAGDKVNVTYGNNIEKRYTVKGIFYTEFIQTDTQAFISEREFNAINPLIRNRASSIRIKLDEAADPTSVVTQISHLKDELRILTWVDYAGIVHSLTTSFNVINTILNVVNLLVAGATIFIVTYIDVSHRRRQIGIQRAIGISPSSITMSYLMRAVFYVVVSAILGTLVFIYIVTPLEARYPFHFPFGDVYLLTDFSSVVRTVVVMLCASLIAAFVPVIMAFRIKILDTIWG
ncbi:MAG: FtsX-like permease family protein [Dehalococcoidales bacterium]|nr:FtsX-like permease family protein [Dehalococcoidales bacterium]